MGMLMMMNETSSCIQQPPRQVLASLPLLVYEYEDHPDATEQPTPAVDHPDSTATAATATKMLIYSLSEQSIVYATHGRPQPQPQMMMDGNNSCFSTPQGWLLILGQVSDAWLWHPLTGETIALPPIHDDHYIPTNCNCLLTHASAAHPDCAVILLDVADPLMWFCQVNGGTDRRWGQHTYDIGDCDVPEEFLTPSMPTKNVIANVAALRGKLHFLSTPMKMCVVDLDFPADHHAHPPAAEFHEFDVNELEFPDGLCSGTICLVESMDELFAVCICYVDFDPANIGAVVVYKMAFCGQKPVAWHRVHDIGDDRAFLLTKMNMATWCSASTNNNLKGNTICFQKKSLVASDSADRDLYIYDILEQTMEIAQVHNQDLEIARTQPYWINVPPC